MTMATTKAPDAESVLQHWKDWLRDHTDGHDGSVVLDARVVLDLVKARDSAREEGESIRKALESERERL